MGGAWEEAMKICTRCTPDLLQRLEDSSSINWPGGRKPTDPNGNYSNGYILFTRNDYNTPELQASSTNPAQWEFSEYIMRTPNEFIRKVSVVCQKDECGMNYKNHCTTEGVCTANGVIDDKDCAYYNKAPFKPIRRSTCAHYAWNTQSLQCDCNNSAAIAAAEKQEKSDG